MTENPYYAGPPRGYHPADPRDLIDPEIQAATNRRGALLVREVLADCGARTAPKPGETCVHGNRADRTPAGDAWCGDCRRDESGPRLRELADEQVPDDENEPPEEDAW
ncbi:hypothetical protein GCM10027059_26740 [Myceligenerans halotolerans]